MSKITITYGTGTGNSKKLAVDFATKAKKAGVQPKLISLDQYRLEDIAKEEYLLTVISTQGDGEPPAAAKKFYDHIHNKGFKVDKLKYGVLALGDTAYPLFCKAGEDVDVQLEKLGGNRLVPLQKCDVDYEESAYQWFSQVLQQLDVNVTDIIPADMSKKVSRKRNYTGKVLTNLKLNDRGSQKETYHLEIAADELDYEPGDCIGIKLDVLAPRLYSISSSLQAHSGEVHLTVARNKFSVGDEIKYGICSDYLSKLQKNDQLEFYVHRNSLFKLPPGDKNVIMIGPGTGIAPFRSFLAERDATGATGRNWLFFGDQHFESDFLYQTEIQNWIQTGVLTRASLAFSRDQKEKVYVQHKMLKHAAVFFEWLQLGAYLYVCGAKDPMSVDVENALLQIIEEQGGMSKQSAVEYLDRLKEEERYLKDVY